MRLYIDGTFYRISGIGRVYESVLRALLESDEVSSVCTVVPDSRRAVFENNISSSKLETRFVPFTQMSVGDLTWKTLHIQSFRPSPDLLFFPNINIPYGVSGRIISMIHDLTPLSPLSGYPLWQRLAFRHLVKRALRISTRALSGSRTALADITREFGSQQVPMDFIYHWIEPSLWLGNGDRQSASELVSGDYLLVVGNRFPHKNLGGAVEAFRLLSTDFRTLKLVVVGQRGRFRDEVDAASLDPSLSQRIIQLQDINEHDLRNLYSRARALVFPSFMEGFGLPPLEAMLFGTPVICSDIPVLREVCGSAPLYADPHSAKSIATQIRRILDGDAVRRVSRESAAELFRKFDRDTLLRKYLSLFSEVSKEKHSQEKETL